MDHHLWVVAALLAVSAPAQSNDFDDCILEHAKGGRESTTLIMRACGRKHPLSIPVANKPFAEEIIMSGEVVREFHYKNLYATSHNGATYKDFLLKIFRDAVVKRNPDMTFEDFLKQLR